jgi:serine/threonine-protein kinase RsbW
MAKRWLSMTIPSDKGAGHHAKELILQDVTANGFNHQSAWAVNLALEEAIANAIKHGNRHDPGKSIHIVWTVTPRRIEIIIEDQGTGFDRVRVPDPRKQENLEKCSGRGIFLIESYMNKVEWTNGGRRLRMIRMNDLSGPHPA